MHKTAVLLILIFYNQVYLNILNAQIIGIKGGIVYNNLIVDPASEEPLTYNPMNGYSLGANYKYQISQKFNAVIGFCFIQKNYNVQYDVNSIDYHVIHSNNYIQVPLNIQVEIVKIKRIKFFYSAGFFGGYWVCGRIKGSIPNAFDNSYDIDSEGTVIQYFNLTSYDEKITFNKERDIRKEFGLDTGIQIIYPFLKSSYIDIDLTYYRSFSNQQYNYMRSKLNRKNSTFAVSLGVMLTINN